MSQVTDSVIHDIGYQRYTGVRLGRGYAVWSLYVHSLRSAFGIGNGLKAKIFPWSIVGCITMVAAVITAIVSSGGGKSPLTYAQFSDAISTLTVLFVASAASEVVSRDLHAGVLPLYFSRPMRRADYALAKLTAVATAVLLVLGVPQLLMFAGFAFSTKKGFSGVLHELARLSAGLANSLLHALVIGSIGVLAAALCRRRLFAAVAVVAVFLVTMPVAEVLASAGGTPGELSGLASPLTTLIGAREWLFEASGSAGSFGPAYGLMVVLLFGVATLGLIVRYRKVKV